MKLYEIDLVIPFNNRGNTNSLIKTLNTIKKNCINIDNIMIFIINDSTKHLHVQIEGLTLTILNNNKNIGISKSFSKWHTKFNAKYIARLDAGDSVLNNRFEKQLNFLEKNQDIGLIGCKSSIILENNGIEQSRYSSKSNFSSQNSLKQYLKMRNPFIHGSLMFRKALFNQIGGYDDKFIVSQDYDLIIRFSKVTNVFILDDILNEHTFFYNTSSTYKNNKKQILTNIRIKLKNYNLTELLFSKFVLILLLHSILLLIPNNLLKIIRKIKGNI